jgi:HlyD family secretion protein
VELDSSKRPGSFESWKDLSSDQACRNLDLLLDTVPFLDAPTGKSPTGILGTVRKLLRVLTAIAATVLVLGVLALVFGGEETIEVNTTQVGKTTLIRYVRAAGHLQPSNQVRISASVTGDLAKLFVQENQSVKRGDVLAEIDPGSLDAVMSQKQAAVRETAAQASSEQTRLEQAQKSLRGAEGLLKSGLVSAAELARIRGDVRIAHSQYEAALQRMKQAKGELAEAQLRVGRTRLIAPMEGTVISVEKKEGERVRGSEFSEDVLLTIAPLDAMEVEVEVSEHDVTELHEGESAVVVLPALADQEVPGKVAKIATSATIVNRGQPGEVTRFKVRLLLDVLPKTVRPGMTGRVTIQANTRENVLAVPFEAVTARLPDELEQRTQKPEDAAVTANLGAVRKPVPVVFVVEKGRAVARQIKTGVSSESAVEVLEGLKEGEVVIVGPFQALSRDLWSGAEVTAKPIPGPAAQGPKSEPGTTVAGRKDAP